MTTKDYFFHSTTVMRVNAASEEEAYAQLNELVQAQVNDLEWEPCPSDSIPNPALAAIEYTLDTANHDHESGVQLDFLEYWSLGEFDTLRRNWENIPDEVFIGADSQFKPTVKSECIPFVLDARTMKPVKLSELEEYSFCNEDEDLYLHEIVIRVSQDALDESKEIVKGIPDNFTNDLQLLKLVKSNAFNLNEFKNLSLWSQDALEYDQAVLLSLLLPTYVTSNK